MENIHDIPITDNHIHIDQFNGQGPIAIAKQFYNAGGRVMMIPNKPAWTFGEPENFKKAMDLCIRYCDEIKNNTNVKAFPIVGIHPMEYRKLIEKGKTYEEAFNIVKDGLNYGGELIKNQKAIAIGEIGRPHYPIEDNKEMEYHNKIIKYCLNLGKDLNCPVMIHTESFKEAQYKELAQMADESSFNKDKLIKHFAGADVKKEENHGIMPSVMSSKTNIKKAFKESDRFFMETDFMDDNRRPGAVLGCKTVPRRVLSFIDNEIIGEEQAFKVHKDNVERVYEISLDD